MLQNAISNNPFSTIGRWVIFGIQETGRIALFLTSGFLNIFSRPANISRIFEQIYFIGAKSVLVICLTGAFTGMVLGLQGYYVLVKYGSSGSLGAAVTISLIREMGPVLTAIMITARAGSAMSAEIGIMRISEQIDALKTMGINPLRFLFSPRLAAGLISFPILTSIFDVVGILGGFLTGSLLLGVSPGIYFSKVESSVVMSDINGGFIKSIAFAIVVITISCYQGYYTHRQNDFGAKGVGLSTTSAVVRSCVLILIVDYVLTSILL
ncbi:MAG: ABC transporter permease [Deltaproteobacteria bacterium]|nr:ABC transporter permease [Deltaproteobacteria bacterium]MBW1813115.1 ABC transporter permease [Deltaproteobacteria bacterium]MBW1845809.1 ABC transporter permease [Deltaproteobacteria bacterium]MBW1983376.1 ABC transporter permease [Deltaproteobacteria bacterium]MBW2179100.1 ABC transporter permease [Deltaproteobacteria bacterium]